MENKEIKTYRLIIKGKVQNVGFRHWFSDLAISLGLNGYVQNKESKDEVEAIIQGDMQSILSITEKSKTGPETSSCRRSYSFKYNQQCYILRFYSKIRNKLIKSLF